MIDSNDKFIHLIYNKKLLSIFDWIKHKHTRWLWISWNMNLWNGFCVRDYIKVCQTLPRTKEICCEIFRKINFNLTRIFSAAKGLISSKIHKKKKKKKKIGRNDSFESSNINPTSRNWRMNGSTNDKLVSFSLLKTPRSLDFSTSYDGQEIFPTLTKVLAGNPVYIKDIILLLS